MDDLKVGVVPDGDLVLTVPRPLRVEELDRLRELVRRKLPGRDVMVLGDGMQLRRVDESEQLARIEAKLDALIAALASDEDDEPQYSLDGDLVPGERAEGTPL